MFHFVKVSIDAGTSALAYGLQGSLVGTLSKSHRFRTRKLQINNISPASILKFLARSKTIGFWQSSHSEMSRGVLFLTSSLQWDQEKKLQQRNWGIAIYIYMGPQKWKCAVMHVVKFSTVAIVSMNSKNPEAIRSLTFPHIQTLVSHWNNDPHSKFEKVQFLRVGSPYFALRDCLFRFTDRHNRAGETNAELHDHAACLLRLPTSVFVWVTVYCHIIGTEFHFWRLLVVSVECWVTRPDGWK